MALVAVPPHDLIVQWPSPVSFDTLRIDWDSNSVRGFHYGLEYWDDKAGIYRLVFEESSNDRSDAVHRFRQVTASKIRFTVFRHTVRYHALVLRGLILAY